VRRHPAGSADQRDHGYPARAPGPHRPQYLATDATENGRAGGSHPALNFAQAPAIAPAAAPAPAPSFPRAGSPAFCASHWPAAVPRPSPAWDRPPPTEPPHSRAARVASLRALGGRPPPSPPRRTAPLRTAPPRATRKGPASPPAPRRRNTPAILPSTLALRSFSSSSQAATCACSSGAPSALWKYTAVARMSRLPVDFARSAAERIASRDPHDPSTPTRMHSMNLALLDAVQWRKPDGCQDGRAIIAWHAARRKVKRASLSEIRKGIIAGATSGRR